MSDGLRSDRMFRLDGEIALITGGGTGLGLAVARCMAAAGARVVVVGRREATLREAVDVIGPSGSWEVADITRFDTIEDLVARVAERVGPVSILVNNAGLHLKRFALDTSVEAFRQVLDTHVLAAHEITRRVLPGMIARRHGSVIFTASMTSFIGIPQVLAYTAAKSAYVGMVRALSAEVAGDGVRVNAIAPGWIRTPMLKQALEDDETRQTRVLSRTPMGRFGDPTDVGWAAVYLASPAAAFVAGTVLPVDGGAAYGF